MMKVEVITPEDYMGDVVGDINRRRGIILGMDDGPSGKEISAEIPLAEMFGYATDLRSLSQGRATYNMEFNKYWFGKRLFTKIPGFFIPISWEGWLVTFVEILYLVSLSVFQDFYFNY